MLHCKCCLLWHHLTSYMKWVCLGLFIETLTKSVVTVTSPQVVQS